MKKINYHISIIIMIVVVTMFVSGCGVSEKSEKKLFDCMKENGFLNLNCEYEDYDERRSVDQSPIPANIIYYDYNQDGILYTIDYDRINLGNDDWVYRVRVETTIEEESDTVVYYFELETFEFREKK